MSNYDADILIQNIRSLMKDKNITQEKLADILGMSQSNVSKALSKSDKKSFTLDQVVGIAKYFNISIDVLVGNRNSATISTGPRATAAFLAKLIANQDAKYYPIEITENVYEMDYGSYQHYPNCKHEIREVTYPAIYLPSYWSVPERITNEDENAVISEAMQCGNDTRMLPVNDFLRHFKEIFELYDKGGLSEETYNAVLSDMLNRLRE